MPTIFLFLPFERLHPSAPSPLIHEQISVGSGDNAHKHADLQTLFLIGYTSPYLHAWARLRLKTETPLAPLFGVSLLKVIVQRSAVTSFLNGVFIFPTHIQTQRFLVLPWLLHLSNQRPEVGWRFAYDQSQRRTRERLNTGRVKITLPYRTAMMSLSMRR